MDKNSKLGYCKSGADLTMQLKPQGVFSPLSHTRQGSIAV